MTSRTPSVYADRIEADLRENILPFWIEHAVDRQSRSFISSLTNDLSPDRSTERGMLLTARILWTYAAAFCRYRDPTYLAMANYAFTDLLTHFHDQTEGGFWWSIAPDGTVLSDRKQIYGQAFALYALAEYHAATGRPEPLALAITLFHLVETRARDTRHDGYLEAFDRQWNRLADMRLSAVDLNEPKSQNTHLHLLEAYTNLLRWWPDIGLHRALTGLLEVMLTRMVNSATGHLGLFYSEDWAPRSDRISYGHDIEAAWLLTEAAGVLQDPGLQARTHAFAVQISEVTLAEGVDEDGGVYNEGSLAGPTNTNKEWWPQAEAMVGFLNAYQLSRDERFLRASFNTWDFIERRIIDHQHGEWFRGVTRDGYVLSVEHKVSFWKCPYHNGRAGLESVRRLRSMITRP